MSRQKSVPGLSGFGRGRWPRAGDELGFALVLKGKQGQPLKPKPVTNARDDKLLTGFWRDSFVTRRCLIPVTQWAEPQGDAGCMTRTWYSRAETPVMAVARLWRASAEWGDVYTMVMVESSPQMAKVHDRMQVILSAGHGSTA